MIAQNNNPLYVVNQPLNESFNSQPQQLQRMVRYAIQGNITIGNPTGTFTLQGSNDALSGNINPVLWTTIDDSSKAVSAQGTFMYNVGDVGYTWVRLAYADGSSGTSTGILTASVNIKEN